MSFEYVRQHYHVPAEIGRRITVEGRPGIIVRDLGHHLGVNFDSDKPGLVRPCHPTWEVVYLGMGVIRKPSRGQVRYARYLDCAECFDSFLEFCRWEDRTERLIISYEAPN